MKTGTGSDGLDLLILGALIVVGTWSGLWFMTAPHHVQAFFVSKTLSLTAFLFAQPGLIGGVKLFTISTIPLRRRLALGTFVLAVFGCLVPMLIVSTMESRLLNVF